MLVAVCPGNSGHGDDHHRRGAIGDKVLEPRSDGKMIRGHPATADPDPEYRFGEHHTALLATAEHIYGLLKLILAEAQRLQNAFGAGADAEAIEPLEGLSHVLVARHDRVEVHIGLAHPMLQLPHLMLQFFHVAEGR